MNYGKIKEKWKGTVELQNGGDIVACVPPVCFFYRHPVKKTFIGEKPRWYTSYKVM